jgi:hypothetical protein
MFLLYGNHEGCVPVLRIFVVCPDRRPSIQVADT